MLAPSRSTSIAGGPEPAQVAFRHALAAGKESQCREIISQRIESGATRSETAEDLITDAMHGFGQAWECGEMDVYQERRGCDIALRLLNEMRAQMPEPSASAPIAIGGSPEGDPYSLPTAMIELALREVGWRATSLGANLPLDSFLQATHDYSPQLVWMSVSVIVDPAMFVASQTRLADAIGESVPLLIGGRALSDKVRPRLHYTAHCDSIRHMVELAAMMRLNFHQS